MLPGASRVVRYVVHPAERAACAVEAERAMALNAMVETENFIVERDVVVVVVVGGSGIGKYGEQTETREERKKKKEKE